VVLDSTAALAPKQELEGTMEDQTMALQARFLSTALRKITPSVGKSKMVVIFVNQIRETMKMWGNPNTTPGGRALKFYSSVRIEINSMAGKDNVYKDDKGVRIGHRVRVSVQKNKVAPPFRSCEFNLFFDRGIDLASEIPQLALDMGISQVVGRTYTLTGYNGKWGSWEDYVEGITTLPVEELQILREKIISKDKENRMKSFQHANTSEEKEQEPED